RDVLRPQRGARRADPRRDAGTRLVVTAAIEARSLSFHFGDDTTALRGASFRAGPGESLAPIAPNSAANATPLLRLAGVVPEPGRGHGEGEVLLFGQRLTPDGAGPARRQVGLLFQDPDDQLFCPTVGEDVAFGPEQLGTKGEALRRCVAEALARVGLAG